MHQRGNGNRRSPLEIRSWLPSWLILPQSMRNWSDDILDRKDAAHYDIGALVPPSPSAKWKRQGKFSSGKWGNGRKWQPTVFLKRQKPTVKFQEVEVVAQNRGSGSHLGQHQNNQAIGWGLCYGNFCFRDNATWKFLSSHNHNWETLRDNSLNNRNLVLCDVDEWELGRN